MKNYNGINTKMALPYKHKNKIFLKNKNIAKNYNWNEQKHKIMAPKIISKLLRKQLLVDFAPHLASIYSSQQNQFWQRCIQIRSHSMKIRFSTGN